MTYAYYDLGEQPEGSTVVVRLSGSSANVMLLDPQNLARYRGGQPFSYVGGLRRRSPVRLEVPQDGHWYAVLDLGGRGGQVQGAVSVEAPDGSPVALQSDGSFVEGEESSPPARSAS